MTRTRLVAAAMITLLALVGATACGSSTGEASTAGRSSSSPKPSMSPAMSGHSSGSMKQSSIMIMGYKYSGTARVAPGSRITVMNHDSEAHTVTADKGDAFDVTVPAGKSVTLTAPGKPGSYAYHCAYHAGMHGMLTVG